MSHLISVEVTAVIASLTALLAIFLGYRVVKFRLGRGVAIGEDGSAEFQTAVRTHANLIEWAPITLLLLLLAELQGGNSLLLWAFGVVFFVGRCLHAYGFITAVGGSHKGRFYGTLFSWLALLLLAIVNLLLVVLSA